jgi:hypothetical protein
MGRACSMNWREEEFISDIDGKPEEKRSVGRPRRMWVDNIKIL